MILVIAAIIGLAVFFLLNRTKDESQEVMYKETTVKKGTLTSGVTESGSVDIGTITQDIEALEDIESTSSSSGSSDRIIPFITPLSRTIFVRALVSIP